MFSLSILYDPIYITTTSDPGNLVVDKLSYNCVFRFVLMGLLRPHSPAYVCIPFRYIVHVL